MAEYIIRNADGHFLGFGPRAWHAEYPEARTFENLSTARAAARVTKVLCEIVEDYGLDSQRVIDTIG